MGVIEMRSIMGLELRNIKISPGIAHDMLHGELWLHKVKIGEIYDDGWIDEIYMEFSDQESQDAFMERVKKYNKKHSIEAKEAEPIIKELLFLSHSYRSTEDKSLPGCSQITFM
jgi:hypothetical protein